LSFGRTETEKKRIWIWREGKTARNPIEQRWLERTYASGPKAQQGGIAAVKRGSPGRFRIQQGLGLR
jgi:hypothetical protein